MKDRESLYPGRVQLIPVPGQPNLFDLIRADQPTEPGTMINKANLFRDTTALALGLPSTAVPDDALRKLSSAALIRRTLLTVKKGGLVSSFAEGSTIYLPEGGTMRPYVFSKHNYESGLNGNGRTLIRRKYTLATPIAWGTAGNNAYANNTLDTYLNTTHKSLFPAELQAAMGQTSFRYTPGGGAWTVGTLSRSMFVLSGTEYGLALAGSMNVEGSALPNAATLRLATDEAGGTRHHYTRSPVLNTANAFTITTAGALQGQAAQATAYILPAFTLPANYVVEWYEDAFGNISAEPQYATAAETVLGEKVGGFTNIQRIEYVGTGTTGAANPNRLQFSFVPQLIFVRQLSGAGFAETPLIQGTTDTVVSGSTRLSVTWGGTTVSWFVTGLNSNAQLNVAGAKYIAVALG